MDDEMKRQVKKTAENTLRIMKQLHGAKQNAWEDTDEAHCVRRQNCLKYNLV